MYQSLVHGCAPDCAAGYWDAKPEQLERLRQLYMDVEDKIEVGGAGSGSRSGAS
jgi:hypothetical protein